MKARNFSITRMAITIGLFLSVLIGILWVRSPLFSNASAKASSQSIQNVSTKAVQYQDSYSYQRYFIGQVEAVQSALLGFELGGMIKNMPFDEGDTVKKGDVLARLDTERLTANKKQVEANLALANANAKLAQTTYERVFSAHRANAVTDQEKDEAREGRNAARAAKSVAKAQLESIQVDIEKTKLAAPFDGVIIKRMVDEGRVVLQGQSILEIQQNIDFELRVGVTSAVADRLKLGQKKTALIHNKEYQATVKAILPFKTLTRTVDVILTLPKSVEIRAGDIARVEIERNIKKRGFWLPITALIEGRRGLWSLYVLNNNNQVERRTVIIAHTKNTKAFVFGAVNDGEQVVVKGASKLVPTQQVKVVSDAN